MNLQQQSLRVKTIWVRLSNSIDIPRTEYNSIDLYSDEGSFQQREGLSPNENKTIGPVEDSDADLQNQSRALIKEPHRLPIAFTKKKNSQCSPQDLLDPKICNFFLTTDLQMTSSRNKLGSYDKLSAYGQDLTLIERKKVIFQPSDKGALTRAVMFHQQFLDFKEVILAASSHLEKKIKGCTPGRL